MPKVDETDRKEAERRAVEAAQTWYPTEGGIRDYVALAAFVAILVGVAMAWSCLPTALVMLKADVPSGDRFQFFFAYGSLVLAPAAAWALWRIRRFAFAIGFLIMFGLAVGALLPVARG